MTDKLETVTEALDSDEMVERVAKALLVYYGGKVDDIREGQYLLNPEDDYISDENVSHDMDKGRGYIYSYTWRDYRRQAKAAIKAMEGNDND
jgi:hypothetical protein